MRFDMRGHTKMCYDKPGQHDAAYLSFDTSYWKFTVLPKNSPHSIFEFFNRIGRFCWKTRYSYEGNGCGQSFGKGWFSWFAIIVSDDGLYWLNRLICRHAGTPILLSGGGWLSSFAILRKFCTVAVSRNSSCAPLIPRKRKRSTFSMRFMCANSISTFFRCRRVVL